MYCATSDCSSFKDNKDTGLFSEKKKVAKTFREKPVSC